MFTSIGSRVVLRLCDRDSQTPASRGFTLLEVVVAFAILSIALVALLKGLSMGFKSLEAAELHAHAAMIAQSKLAELQSRQMIGVGQESGKLGNGLGWRTEVSRFLADGPNEQSALTVEPVRIDVSVFVEDRALTRLTTVSLARVGE